PALASDHPTPDLEAELRELALALRTGVAALSPRDATALSLTVHLGFGPTEVAAALGISYGNAKVVLHRARHRLRSALEQQRMLDGFDGSSA
ncbi:MAG: RNA polymerase sigma factor, partial [Acidimicrobiales bacterium]